MIGRLAARAVIGGLFIGHGTQKLFGWFDGPGPEGTEQMMGKIGMHPSRVRARRGIPDRRYRGAWRGSARRAVALQIPADFAPGRVTARSPGSASG